ncbi:MAG: phosphate signaling complex protein PhoU [Magnetococcales bacterium]|nr:phosphate signaling complex protein PhoU [Magnetococcales bacterium]MBF0434177.1 phosphate signaling complex protein PhoU [Magnetococcales bacterium]
MPRSPNRHTIVAFDQELEQLDALLIRQFAVVRNMIDDSRTAVSHYDVALAKQVILKDPEVDELELTIEERCIKILALRNPMADDLRWVVATQKASSELERIGDFSKNIGKRVGVLALNPLPEACNGLHMMNTIILEQLDRVLEAWVEETAEAAIKVWEGDEAVDALYDSLFRELLTHMMEAPKNISSCIHLLFIAKNLERIGDHITNIAEDVYYRITGKKPPAERPKADKTCSASSYCIHVNPVPNETIQENE